MQALLTQLAWEEEVSLQVQVKPKTNEGQRMAAILQRMADRQALSHSIDPVVWKKEIREDRPLTGRECDNLFHQS